MRTTTLSFLALTATLVAAGPSQAQDAPAPTDEELIASAESAAPDRFSKESTIYDVDMRVVREGTNGWWCMPDYPPTPGNDPMCGDANAMAWLMAVMNKTEPPENEAGLSYMLAGGSTANNLDPFATEPPEGAEWLTDGPHVMIFNVPDLVAAYPEEAMPDTTRPYVMYPGTPYAHLMVPTQ